MRRIEHDPNSSESNSMVGGDPRDNMGFHVSGNGASAQMQFPLGGRIRHDRIDARHAADPHAGDHARKLATPHAVGRISLPRIRDLAGNDAIAGAQRRIESSGNAEADDAAAARADSLSKRTHDFGFGAPADDQDLRPRRDAGLESETNQDDDRWRRGTYGNMTRQDVIGVSQRLIAIG